MNKADCLVGKSGQTHQAFPDGTSYLNYRNSEVYVAELNHLKEENEEIGEGQGPGLWEGNNQSSQVAETVLSKGCKTHLLFWFSVSITVQILHFKNSVQYQITVQEN